MNSISPAVRDDYIERICMASGGSVLKIMEVCGSHTMAIAKSGLRTLLPDNVRLVSGPGCPVCVTPTQTIDRAVALARLPDVILASFGDMVRVPGTEESLEQAQAAGASVAVVYSPRDCLRLAIENEDKRVIFFAVGFETTQPGIAAAVAEAERLNISNFLLLSAMKLIPPALKVLVQDKRVGINGFILPGHVSAVLGLEPYGFLAREFGLSGVVAGFEGRAILSAVARLAELAAGGTAAIENEYRGVVRPDGNPVARKITASVFEPTDARWRGMGELPASGLVLRPEYAGRDAASIEVVLPDGGGDDPRCGCGDVLRGLIAPVECAMFGSACTPARPIGPCMVSVEGACQAYYRYRV